MLHITSGDSAAEQMRAGKITGEILPWRDILHEGPLPANLTLEALRHIRARFVASCGWGELPSLLELFAARNAALESFRRHEEVLLWFEEDLVDQLQLIQILDWFEERNLGETRLSLVNATEPLGTLSPDAFRVLWEGRRAVMPQEMEAAREAWKELRNPDPSGLEKLLQRGVPALPRLGPALLRFLQEFPSVKNGLSRTEEGALQAIARGRSVLHEAFIAAHHEREERVFLGDVVFALSLRRLSDVEIPLLAMEDGSPVILPRDEAGAEAFWRQRAVITGAGKDVASGKLDHVRLNGIQRWIGGTFLQGRGPLWRWDEDRQALTYV